MVAAFLPNEDSLLFQLAKRGISVVLVGPCFGPKAILSNVISGSPPGLVSNWACVSHFRLGSAPWPLWTPMAVAAWPPMASYGLLWLGLLWPPMEIPWLPMASHDLAVKSVQNVWVLSFFRKHEFCEGF